MEFARDNLHDKYTSRISALLAKALCWAPDERPSLETWTFCLYFSCGCISRNPQLPSHVLTTCFTLKQLRLPVLNEMHTNSYTGPRLKTFYEAIQVKFYIKSKLAKCRITYLQLCIFQKLIAIQLKAMIFLLFLACCTKKIIKIEIIVLLWQHEPAFSVD